VFLGAPRAGAPAVMPRPTMHTQNPLSLAKKGARLIYNVVRPGKAGVETPP